MGAGIGNMGIVAVRAETTNGRKVKTIEAKDGTTETAMVVTLSIDEAGKLPVRRINRLDCVNSVTTAAYDFNAKIAFPKASATKYNKSFLIQINRLKTPYFWASTVY